VKLTAYGSNAAPVAVDDSYSTTQGVVINQAAPGVLGNDTDAEGSSLTAAVVSDPTSGALMLNANGSFSYTPNPGFTGADSFSYRANDGGLDSNTATVAITVSAAPSSYPENASFEADSDGDGIPDGWAVNFSYMRQSGERASNGSNSLKYAMTDTAVTHRRPIRR